MAMQKITKGYPNWDVPYNENVEEYNNTIGNIELDTENKTIKGAINEVKNNLDNIKENEQINAADISKLKTSVAQNASSLNEKANLATTPSKTIANITFFVDASNGNDDNDGLQISSPFKTISKAISMIPQIVNHTVNINVSSGVYNENINIMGFVGNGSISINGGTNIDEAVDFVVNSCFVKLCSCNISIKGFFVNTTENNGFSLYSNIYVSISFCICNSTTSSWSGVYCTNGGTLNISNCSISNRYIAIKSNLGALIISDSNEGDNNTTVLNSTSGGTIAKKGTQPSGVTAELIYNGGDIR